jgi:predicted HD phosphohydrolase
VHQPLDYITRFVNELQVGTVNVREVPGYRLELTPFGGIKDSGLGYKEGVQEAIKSFTNLKTYSLPWDEAVLEPIKLHVDAKRYLCATRPDYFAALSADSQRSLGLQGGVFSQGQAANFIQLDGATDAVRVRLWDDRAKAAGLVTPPLTHYLARARRCALAGA